MKKGRGIRLLEDYSPQIAVHRDERGLITGGLIIGDTKWQNVALLMDIHKGEIKDAPLVGIGLEDFLNDEDYRSARREIIAQLEMDGMRIKRLKIGNGVFDLEAEYK
jgi:hypothetical protein